MSGEFFISIDSERKFVNALDKIATAAGVVAEAYAKKSGQPVYNINVGADVSGMNVARSVAEFVATKIKNQGA